MLIKKKSQVSKMRLWRVLRCSNLEPLGKCL